MSILKKIAVAGLLGAVGIVLYRFLRIVVSVLREEFAKKVKCNSDGFTISTKKGTLSSSTEDDLFWEWIDYLKSI